MSEKEKFLTALNECYPLFKNQYAATRYIVELCNNILNDPFTPVYQYDCPYYLDKLEPLCRCDLNRGDKAQLADFADEIVDYISFLSEQEQKVILVVV